MMARLSQHLCRGVVMMRFVRNLKQGTMVCSASVQDAGGAATGITGRGGSGGSGGRGGSGGSRGRDRYASARGAAAAAAAMARSKKPAHFAIELSMLGFPDAVAAVYTFEIEAVGKRALGAGPAFTCRAGQS
jgi:hypothetical protein